VQLKSKGLLVEKVEAKMCRCQPMQNLSAKKKVVAVKMSSRVVVRKLCSKNVWR